MGRALGFWCGKYSETLQAFAAGAGYGDEFTSSLRGCLLRAYRAIKYEARGYSKQSRPRGQDLSPRELPGSNLKLIYE